MSTVPLADDDHLHLQVSEGVCDVLLDGQRVWSFPVKEYPADSSGMRHVGWPPALRSRLYGWAQVEVREHVSGSVVARDEACFGGGAGRVQLVDGNGRPIAMTKRGRVNVPFEGTDDTSREAYLDQVEQVLTTLQRDCGVPAFISYGTLLGAVREGRLIGHDVDADLGYFSEHRHPVDVNRESFRIERVLRAKGWQVLRQNSGFLALFFAQPDGSRRNLDVFACWCTEGVLYQVHDVATPAEREAVLPLGTASLEGRALPVPASPETFLESAYGPSWRVPDPSFEFRPPRWRKRRFNGWTEGLRNHRRRWREFYSGSGHLVPEEPSEFARWVSQHAAGGTILDVGTGTGRDAAHFARHGRRVRGVDYAPSALVRARRSVGADLDAGFETRNLYSLRDCLALGAALSRERGPHHVYARFLLHALSDHGRENFFRLATMLARAGGRCYLEFRTTQDRDTPKTFGQHFRRYLDPAEVAREVDHHRLRIVHQEEGRDRARLGDEDPYVCRMVLERQR